MPEQKRAIVYIDGFNLYFSLKRQGWKHFYWLDPYQLAQELIGELRQRYALVEVRYYTARLTDSDPDKRRRQGLFLDAIRAYNKTKPLEIVYGYYQRRSSRCPLCSEESQTYEEKMTDVRMSLDILQDAVDNRYDLAAVISADTDFVPVYELLRSRYSVETIVFFPDGHKNSRMVGLAGCRTIQRKHYQASTLPHVVFGHAGFKLQRPERWK